MIVGWYGLAAPKAVLRPKMPKLPAPKAATAHVKAKTHFFRDQNLTSVLVPSEDDGVFTGNVFPQLCLIEGGRWPQREIATSDRDWVAKVGSSNCHARIKDFIDRSNLTIHRRPSRRHPTPTTIIQQGRRS